MVENVGRHASRWRWLPSQLKPQHRFVVAISGILLLTFTTLAVAASVFPKSPEASAGPTPVDETTQVEQTGPPVGTGPVEGQLIAYYVVPLTAVWDKGFQAQVLITNTAPTPQGWQVTLVYPQTVTGHVRSWVAGAPQPAVDIGGQRFTFTGATPIAAGQTALLRVEFTTTAGKVEALECTVNGLPCNRP